MIQLQPTIRPPPTALKIEIAQQNTPQSSISCAYLIGVGTI